MDAYLDCLYQHIVESLSHEQLKLVEEYWAACDGKRYLEEKLLFQKAVALGKWMARA
jgi:hypothetical protein